MGDLFRREAASAPMPFTGERLTGAAGGQVQIEHYHRYLFARNFCRDLDVLDVASGEGYGSAQLAQVARSVVGVEYDPAAVASASAAFTRPNLRYCQGDARDLPLADGTIDAVVSFETIEHFDRQEKFVSEVRRVLRPGGLFIVSTPDRDIYSGPNTRANEFHVKELTAQEFLTLLQRQFPVVALIRQRPLVGSALLADNGTAGPPLVFERRGDHMFEACNDLPRAPYFVAVASDRPLPRLPSSLYIERSDIDTPVVLLQQRSQALAKTEAALIDAHAALDQRAKRLEHVEARASDLEVALAEARTALGDLDTRFADSQLALETTRAEVEAARARAAAAHERAIASEQARTIAEVDADALRRELDLIRGSARTFFRQYLPRLRRHVLSLDRMGRTRPRT